MDAAVPSIRLDDLTLGYDRHPAVHHLRGEFAAGSLTAVIGPNGSGKSTLLKGLAGLIKPLSGAILAQGGLRRFAYLPQLPDIDRGFPVGVLDTVSLGLWRRVGAFGRVTPAMRDQARAALDAVGLSGFERRLISDLSAGQFQRVLFARLLLQDAPVYLLDEPFTSVDARTVSDLLRVVAAWHEQGRTVVAVIHDVAQAREHFPQALLLARELLAWGPSGQTLSPDNLALAGRMSEAWNEQAKICLGRAG